MWSAGDENGHRVRARRPADARRGALERQRAGKWQPAGGQPDGMRGSAPGSEPWISARTCLAPPHSLMPFSNRVGSDHDERS